LTESEGVLHMLLVAEEESGGRTTVDESGDVAAVDGGAVSSASAVSFGEDGSGEDESRRGMSVLSERGTSMVWIKIRLVFLLLHLFGHRGAKILEFYKVLRNSSMKQSNYLPSLLILIDSEVNLVTSASKV